MRWFQLQMHKKRRNNNNVNHFYSTQFQRTFNQMKRAVTERGEGGGTRRLHWANKGKRNNPTHNSSVTKWHQSIFILLLLFCCVFYCCSASSFCFREKTQKYSRNRVEMLKWPTESVGTSSSLAGECRQRAPFAFLAPKIQKQQKVGNT